MILYKNQLASQALSALGAMRDVRDEICAHDPDLIRLQALLDIVVVNSTDLRKEIARQLREELKGTRA